MKTEIVRDVWEFYRDNCAGFKEPLRKEMRKLDEYVASVEAENAKLRGELDFYKSQVEGVEEERIRLRERWKEAMAENVKLRDAMYTNAGKHALQHMDEDELRIWATQQAEYIEELWEFATLAWQVLTRNDPLFVWQGMVDDARELGLEEMTDGRADD